MSGKDNINRSVSKISMERVKSGLIKEHKQTNTWSAHTGDEEASEARLFRRFLKCKTGCLVYSVRGHI